MTPLVATSRPFLAPRARVARPGGQVVVEDEEISLTFAGDSACALSAFHDRLDGRHSLDALAGVAGNVALLAATLGILAKERLLIDACAILDAPAGAAFLDAYWTECEFWVREILAQPFWGTVLSGRAPHAVVLGWGIEFFHYVDAANEHMALAVASCRNDKAAQLWFAQHYIEEAGHGAIFLEGLEHSGLDGEAIRAAPPLASTTALITTLNELAMSDPIAYAATFGVMQQSRARKTAGAIDHFYDVLSAYYPFAVGMFGAFRRHALLDAELGHQELVLERIERRRGLASDERRRVGRAVRDIAEQFILFFEGISRYYDVVDVPLLRRGFDVRTLL